MTIRVSLPLFTDYANALGQDRMKIVQRQRRRIEGLEQAYYFYGPVESSLRRAVASTDPAAELADLVDRATSDVQRRHFGQLRDGMLGFQRRHRASLVPVQSGQVWSAPHLEVLIRQHLGLLIDGQAWVVLLYLKERELTQSAANGALWVLESEMESLLPGGRAMVLDVRRAKTWRLRRNANRPGLQGWLWGEAAAYASHWSNCA